MALNLLSGGKRREFRWLPVGSLSRNPHQPRRVFDEQALNELCESIRRYGVITPLTVRRTGGGYELVAGERRLRASIMAGLEAVPCYIVSAEEEDSALMALVENLQRRDLDFFEEALGLQRLTELYGMTQQQAAERVGKTQSAVANKLRLLKLAPETVALVREHGLTERHARTLLRLTDPDSTGAGRRRNRPPRAQCRAGRGLGRPACCAARKQQPSAGRRKVLVRDVRLFLNTVNRAVALMQSAGVGAEVDRKDGPDGLGADH